MMAQRISQSAAAVLMVRPRSFGFNSETAASNAFQLSPSGDVRDAAIREFDALRAALAHAGVQVLVAEDTAAPPKPDALFPNNWVSFHADGTVVLYPMLAENRRLERRAEIIDLVRAAGYGVRRIVDLTPHEADGRYLEGTGSLVLDRPAGVAYAGLSARTDRAVVREFARALDYESLLFESRDGHGRPIYHTNVFLSIGTSFAVLCGEALCVSGERGAVRDRLEASGHEVVDISVGQMQCFAANVLELAAADGPLLVMSRTARAALAPRQLRVLEKHAALLCVDIPTIERVGGGGVRCMLAEIHLPGVPRVS
jgi:hypothetical protein